MVGVGPGVERRVKAAGDHAPARAVDDGVRLEVALQQNPAAVLRRRRARVRGGVCAWVGGVRDGEGISQRKRKNKGDK